MAITISDWMVVAATLSGPVLAVQAQKWLERRNSDQVRKGDVFQTLMRTRGDRTSVDHVAALNTIDITFYGKGPGKRKSSEQLVLDAWSEYRGHLEQNLERLNESQMTVWNSEANRRFVNMLQKIAIALGYSFDLLTLERGGYTPVAHGYIGTQQQTLRHLLVEVLEGRRSIGMDVTSIPGQEPPSSVQRD